jgi:hypothetical protein
VTRDDAQLLFDWLCRHYGYPGESLAPYKALAHCDDNHQRDTNPQTHRQRPRCRTKPTKDRESS